MVHMPPIKPWAIRMASSYQKKKKKDMLKPEIRDLTKSIYPFYLFLYNPFIGAKARESVNVFV